MILVTVALAVVWVVILIVMLRGPRRGPKPGEETGKQKSPAVLWTEEEIRAAKEGREPQTEGAETLPDFRHATTNGSAGLFAVAIPLVRRTLADGSEEIRVVFEKRAEDLDRQPGEICLPGGAAETGESAVQTAVRETAEELLVRREQVKPLARMKTMRAAYGNDIAVFLCELDGYEGTWSQAEVACTFEVPLRFFLETEPDEYENRLRIELADDFPVEKIPGGVNYPWRMRKDRVVFYYYKDWVIWGLTARIMKDAVQVLREVPEAGRLIGRLIGM